MITWVVCTKGRMSGTRNGQAGAKWLARIHAWAARPCWEVKVDAVSGWSEKCWVRSGGRVLRLNCFWPIWVREESPLKREGSWGRCSLLPRAFLSLGHAYL